MTTHPDPLQALLSSDPPDARLRERLHYAVGMMLDAEDFRAEQVYHRGRLARALAYLHGSGTVAGLRVRYQTAPPTVDADPLIEQITIAPGLAIDRLGRLIEVPEAFCLRLDRWYARQTDSHQPELVDGLKKAFHQFDLAASPFALAPHSAVVADVFLRYTQVESGKTPVFAAGPFAALDAVQPARQRDSFTFDLVLRQEATADLPAKVPARDWPPLRPLGNFPDEAAWRTASRQTLEEAILDAWPHEPGSPPHPTEYSVAQPDGVDVFLARVYTKASLDGVRAPVRPKLTKATSDAEVKDAVIVDNHVRLFATLPRLMARLLA